MISDEVDEVIKELFDSLKNRYQNNVQSMKGSEFVFNYVHVICYIKCHIINKNLVGSYINSPDWIKNKKATINLINRKDNECFQYAISGAINYSEIGKHAERLTKIKDFINKYKWEVTNFPSEKGDWKNLRRIILQFLFMFSTLKMKKYMFMLMFQKIIRIMKSNLFF